MQYSHSVHFHRFSDDDDEGVANGILEMLVKSSVEFGINREDIGEDVDGKNKGDDVDVDGSGPHSSELLTSSPRHFLMW